MKLKLMALCLPVLALGACGGADTTNIATMESPVPVEVMSNAILSGETGSADQAFVNLASASDWYEIEAGKLAKVKATSQALKDFGAMMETAHTESTAKLKAAAATANPAILPDPALDAEQGANLATLRDATGSDFDNAYKAQQVNAHEKALAAMKEYAAGGAVPQLRAFAAEASKVVQMHLDKIKSM
ncbi:MAG: DUF4142 domain-containing protein [Pseudomonadota bacterium]